MVRRNSTTPIKDAKIMFWSKTKTGDPKSCWLFDGNPDQFGYGRVSLGKFDRMRAHRFSYMIHHDLLPEDMEGLVIRHICDNPACVNPAHLIPGTHADNMKDKVDRDRQQKGERVTSAKLTAEAVCKIRELYETHSFNQTQLAEMFGVHLATINDLLLRKTWKHV